jgi:hypothetical protein
VASNSHSLLKMAVKFTDDIKELNQRFRNDLDEEVNWFLLKQCDKDEVVVHASGPGGYEEFIEHLDDDMILYGIFRVKAIMAEAESTKRVKFVGVVWTGPKVKVIKRARVSVAKKSVEDFLGAHVVFTAESKDDLQKEDIEKRLTANAGAHRPSGYEF